MRRALKMLLALVVIGIIGILALPTVTYYHDSETRTRLLSMVAQELPRNASMAEMTAFMQRHTMNSGLDEAGQLQYDGFVPQTTFDRFWGDRKVKIILQVDRDTRTFQRAEIQIFYTGP